MYAPSAHNQQPREFLILQNKDHLLRLGQHLKFGKMLPQANAAIITCFNKKIITDPAFIQQDMSACTQNMLLAAHEKGIGAVWIGIYPLNNPGHYLNTYLQLPDYVDIFNIIALGYPDPATSPHNKECLKLEKIHWEEWK
ncbi:MAG: nitroreductase family protein [Candidatus Peribacteria bacterium]|jgi:nitroreductase|nr:nitroreductase family protein [Candidatus Peribacteria bacterium]